MNPTVNAVHVNRPLTNILIAYKNQMYIADSLMPMVPVQQRADIVPKYDQSHWFRDLAQVRSPGTLSRGSGFKVDVTDTYFCQRFSFRFEIPDELRKNTDRPFDMDRDGTEFVGDKMMLKREVSFATDFFKVGVWGNDTTLAGTQQWSDYANSSPLVDIETERETLEGKIAQDPTDLTMGRAVWSKLKWHPDLIDTIKHTQRAQMTTEIFAALIEFARVHIGRAIQTTAAEGTAEASVTYTRIWGKNVMMLYQPQRATLLRPSAGYTFVWQIVPSASQYIKRMRNEEREIDIIEGNSYFDQKKVVASAGLYSSSTVA